ncbi:2-octaprenyl-6-methoxyphenyl hydroxylase [Vibrio ichthyoenteri ATCC 700023]|uniref:2-octaprenyl-6-methoxyphenyl hydroxylase n=1 Tax=Vibrio ichthyoenteri ATCC 700023 TaxID=870968 RepID=F9RWG1_9VIBR|nr:2-octaprenyl-6-methoxyphenyl hydroxylase [Vibrio ichthyoenteri]EGU49218.1 2-octaprenyl-6-methoxyphenyl hydroxylase [Vibrio ichthyoenteri ATCC 700023]
MKQFDVVIAGGAMAGMTLALALDSLSQSQLRIAVVEPFAVDHQAHPGFDSRSIALSFGTVQILQSLDLWSQIAPVATAIKHIHVSDRSHAGMTNIDHSEMAVEALGYVVELADVGRIYQTQLESRPSISLLCPDSVSDIERGDSHNVVTLQSGEQIECRLLVAADGAISSCCQALGFELKQHDFDQVAVIANIRCQQAHQGRAFERFTNQGPLALLPMNDDRMSLVWCLRPEVAERVLRLDDSAFLAQLQQAFGWRLGHINQVGQRASYPLLLRYREQNISHRFAIVGNAAQTLHPIAGQGFNLGIRDVASLAEEVVQSLADVGRYQVLSAFSRRRQADRDNTIAMTSTLVHIFSNDYLSLRIGRNLGLAMMDNIPSLKTPLLQRTLGLVAR